MADKIGIMNDGVLQQYDSPTTVYDEPSQPVRRAVRRQPDHERGRLRECGHGRRHAAASGRHERALRAREPRAAAQLDGGTAAASELALGMRPEAIAVALQPAPGARRRAEVHLIEPLGPYDIVDIDRSADADACARAPPSQFVRVAGRRGVARRSTMRARISSTSAAACRCALLKLRRPWPQVSLTRPQQALRRGARRQRADAGHPRPRVLRAARPHRRGQEHDAALHRRPGAARRRATSALPANASTTGAPRSATWRWCSSSIRCTRTTRCARTWRSR